MRERYDFAEVSQSGNGSWLSCTDEGEAGRNANELKAAMPSAQTRSETNFPPAQIFRLNFHGLLGLDLQVLRWIMGWIGQNGWEPADTILYPNLAGGDASRGTELYYHFRRLRGRAQRSTLLPSILWC